MSPTPQQYLFMLVKNEINGSVKVCWYVMEFFFVVALKICALVQQLTGHTRTDMLIDKSLKPELNPFCYLLALLGGHHFLHVSRIRVKLLTFRLLMSYIYIYIYSTHS